MQALQPLNYSFEIILGEDKRQNIIDRYIWAIYLVWLLAGLGVWFFKGREYLFITVVWPAILLIGNLYNRFEKKKKPKTFLQINDDGLEWFLPIFTRKEAVLWNDLHWIKFEKEEIRFYIASSFSRHLPYAAFSNEDQKSIGQIIKEEAGRREIKMVEA